MTVGFIYGNLLKVFNSFLKEKFFYLYFNINLSGFREVVNCLGYIVEEGRVGK